MDWLRTEDRKGKDISYQKGMHYLRQRNKADEFDVLFQDGCSQTSRGKIEVERKIRLIARKFSS